MALPQRQEPEEAPQRDYGALPPEKPVRASAVAWWWVLWLIIIGLFIWWAGWGWGGSGGWWWGTRGAGYPGAGPAAGAPGYAAAANSAVMSGPGVQVLNATDKSAFMNRPFQVNNVPVQSMINDKALWIGSNSSSPTLTILKGPGNSVGNADIHPGNLVNVTGTVEKAPPAAEAKAQWQLSDNDANRLEREGVYIQASEMTNAHP